MPRKRKPFIANPDSPIGFAGKPVRKAEQPIKEPRRVPIGFAPGQTTEQIELDK